LIFALLLGCFEKEEIKEQKIQKEEIVQHETCNDDIIVSQTAKNITDIQKDTAIVIEKNFNNLQIPKNITAAAIVNAFAESRLKPKVIGDNGNSVGLFQLNKFGLGSKMTVQHRQDANINSTVVAVQILKNQKLLDKEKKGATIPELASIFVEDIMRPKEIEAEKEHRAKLAKKIFPTKIKEKCITA